MTPPVFIHPRLGGCDCGRREELVVGPPLVQNERFDHEIGPFRSFEMTVALRAATNDPANHLDQVPFRVAVPDLLPVPHRCVHLAATIDAGIVTSVRARS